MKRKTNAGRSGFTMCKRVKSNRMLNGCVHNGTFDPCESVSPRDFALPRVRCNCVFVGSEGSRGRERERKEEWRVGQLPHISPTAMPLPTS